MHERIQIRAGRKDVEKAGGNSCGKGCIMCSMRAVAVRSNSECEALLCTLHERGATIAN